MNESICKSNEMTARINQFLSGPLFVGPLADKVMSEEVKQCCLNCFIAGYKCGIIDMGGRSSLEEESI